MAKRTPKVEEVVEVKMVNGLKVYSDAELKELMPTSFFKKSDKNTITSDINEAMVKSGQAGIAGSPESIAWFNSDTQSTCEWKVNGVELTIAYAGSAVMALSKVDNTLKTDRNPKEARKTAGYFTDGKFNNRNKLEITQYMISRTLEAGINPTRSLCGLIAKILVDCYGAPEVMTVYKTGGNETVYTKEDILQAIAGIYPLWKGTLESILSNSQFIAKYNPFNSTRQTGKPSPVRAMSDELKELEGLEL